jgi:hypothetical protein
MSIVDEIVDDDVRRATQATRAHQRRQNERIVFGRGKPGYVVDSVH